MAREIARTKWSGVTALEFLRYSSSTYSTALGSGSRKPTAKLRTAMTVATMPAACATCALVRYLDLTSLKISNAAGSRQSRRCQGEACACRAAVGRQAQWLSRTVMLKPEPVA